MGTLTIPHSFTNGVGNTADASQVNANFAAVATVVNGQIDTTNLSFRPLRLGTTDGGFVTLYGPYTSTQSMNGGSAVYADLTGLTGLLAGTSGTDWMVAGGLSVESGAAEGCWASVQKIDDNQLRIHLVATTARFATARYSFFIVRFT